MSGIVESKKNGVVVTTEEENKVFRKRFELRLKNLRAKLDEQFVEENGAGIEEAIKDLMNAQDAIKTMLADYPLYYEYMYEYPVSRYCDYTYTVMSKTKLGKKEIMKFYDEEADKRVAAKVIESYKKDKMGYEDTDMGIAVAAREKRREPIKWKDLMGGLQFYEGLEGDGNKFKVLLGS